MAPLKNTFWLVASPCRAVFHTNHVLLLPPFENCRCRLLIAAEPLPRAPGWGGVLPRTHAVQHDMEGERAQHVRGWGWMGWMGWGSSSSVVGALQTVAATPCQPTLRLCAEVTGQQNPALVSVPLAKGVGLWGRHEGLWERRGGVDHDLLMPAMHAPVDLQLAGFCDEHVGLRLTFVCTLPTGRLNFLSCAALCCAQAVSPFIDPVTKKKIAFIEKGPREVRGGEGAPSGVSWPAVSSTQCCWC